MLSVITSYHCHSKPRGKKKKQVRLHNIA